MTDDDAQMTPEQFEEIMDEIAEQEKLPASRAIEEMCCHGCGRQADKYSSGNPECWPCWNRRKLDLPAASHWAKVAKEFLSNVDMYDLSKYLPSCGLTDEEVGIMLNSAQKVRDHSQALLDAIYDEIK